MSGENPTGHSATNEKIYTLLVLIESGLGGVVALSLLNNQYYLGIGLLGGSTGLSGFELLRKKMLQDHTPKREMIFAGLSTISIGLFGLTMHYSGMVDAASFMYGVAGGVAFSESLRQAAVRIFPELYGVNNSK